MHEPQASGLSRDDLDGLIACPYCDLLHRVEPLERHRLARCCQCGAALYQGGPLQLDKLMAWSVTALVLLIIANSFPILRLSAAGREAEVSFFEAVLGFADREMWLLALVVFLTSMAIPLFRIGSLMLVIALAWLGRLRPGRLAHLLRWHGELGPWSMLEIYLLGLLVALVKLRDIAQVMPGLAFYAFFLLVFVLATTATLLDRFHLWRLVAHPERLQ
ncbi:MAG: paraquat-inducible protein A [Gammaproteobacteria bacterium SHHR-1]|uniref:paraquat-inducible protein A n=1 Tax=Magnetovirga frankeli TaxID=947516 RepID=UPI001293C8A5|nr:paraquat-inducible protein A [gamma proteobacterium SS-5]